MVFPCVFLIHPYTVFSLLIILFPIHWIVPIDLPVGVKTCMDAETKQITLPKASLIVIAVYVIACALSVSLFE
jgi:hypothetical protein